MNSEVFFSLLLLIFLILSFIFTIIFTIFKMFGKSKSKYNKLHKWSVVFLVFGLLLMIIFGVKISINKLNRSAITYSSPAEGFTIEEYKIFMDVNESNSIDVKEYITVNFYESGHHGIYRYIPTWLEYTNKNEVTQSKEAKLSNLRAIGDSYTIDTVNGKERIKIGNASYTLPIGNYTYEIDYTYDLGSDSYKNYDEFIFHAFGDNWGTEIKNASIVINLPKKFDTQDKIKFFADKYRKQDITAYVDYYVNGNTIYANLSPNYRLRRSLTVDIELPDGYFVNGRNNYGVTSLILCLSCIIFAIISFILWKKNGKDLNKVPETVEFYPPENLDAAEIGYLYKKDTGRKLSIALIVELASKGFIKIIESDDKTKRTIVKSDTSDINKYIKREIKIVKLKEYKASFIDIHYKAKKAMRELFPNNVNETIVTSNFDKFYEETKYLVDKGFIKIEFDSISQYSEQQLDSIKQKLSLNEIKNKSKMSSNEEIVYNRLFENSDETVLSENYSFYKVFDELAENIRNRYDDKINDVIAYKCMLISSLGFLICTILWILAYCKFEDLNPKFNIIYTISFISNIIIFVFSILMKRKNSYGERIKSKINGFKKYIELAEKNQIEMLAEQNPNYFYDILPYAYVLDVSKKWVEKFGHIPDPSNDMGNFTYHDIDSLNTLSSSVHIPSSSSGGGGGCSSCGGGCSSCGGGGSW